MTWWDVIAIPWFTGLQRDERDAPREAPGKEGD
jgi:hypothetical protein